MFDTLKLIYTQDEALELVGRYEKVYNEKIEELEKENRELKESLDIATKCSSKEEDGIIRLSKENQKLKEKVEQMQENYENLNDAYSEIIHENNYLNEKVGELRKKILFFLEQYEYGRELTEEEKIKEGVLCF